MSAFLLRNQSEFIDAVLEDEHRHTGVRNRPKHELKRKLRLSHSELSESISKPKSTTGRIFFISKKLKSGLLTQDIGPNQAVCRSPWVAVVG